MNTASCPHPRAGARPQGVKTPEGRFALGIEDILNEMAREGWRYLRSDILPSEERQGLTSTTTVYRSVLVFERDVAPAPRPESEATPSAEEMARSLIPEHPES